MWFWQILSEQFGSDSVGGRGKEEVPFAPAGFVTEVEGANKTMLGEEMVEDVTKILSSGWSNILGKVPSLSNFESYFYD